MKADIQKTYWESVAESRWGQYVSGIEMTAILASQALAAPPKVALEVGCEGGRWSKVLADIGWKLICTDTDPKALALCQQRVPSATCVCVDPCDEDLPAEAGAVSLLVCIEVPYVIERDWFTHEAHRILPRGGILVGVQHNRRSLRGMLYGFMLLAGKAKGYPFYQLSYPQWRRRLQATGFDILKEEGFCWFPMRRASNSCLVPFVTRIEGAFGLRKLASLSPWVIFIARKTI
jgi:SAM-dependent methyltransferase